MSVSLVMPTHNRFEYTQKAIQRLLENQNEEFELYLWDNASNDDTAEYLMSLNDPRIKEVYISKTNEGQTGAMNWAWSRTSTELVGKIDNDCLATPGWTYKFALAHKDIPMLGTLAMWHFPHKEFNEKLAEKKIQTFGSHQIFRHPWTCGSGFIIKRKVFLKMGNWISGSHVGTTDYFLKMARAGYINGWYYPLVLQEHMDDPESEYSFFHTKQFDMAYSNSYGYNYAGIRNMQKYLEARKQIIDNLMTAPFDVRYYHPMRQRFRRIINYIRKM